MGSQTATNRVSQASNRWSAPVGVASFWPAMPVIVIRPWEDKAHGMDREVILLELGNYCGQNNSKPPIWEWFIEPILIWLLVWNFLFFHILRIIIPVDFHIFQMG